ncbi:unnamed protein product [Ilex paraguariensis]|uniref:Uncharacterized protein n=1 Tax=Ilex paraguariensis TaxID=185542 RepID=A0ABC8T9P6_9AQUA
MQRGSSEVYEWVVANGARDSPTRDWTWVSSSTRERVGHGCQDIAMFLKIFSKDRLQNKPVVKGNSVNFKRFSSGSANLDS